jgi:type I pantothenate kinase
LNEVICHGIPDSTVLRDGDIINLDVTCYVNGVHGDTNATFFVGDVDEESKLLVRVAEECMWKGIDAVVPGQPLSDIGKAIENHAKNHRMGVIRAFIGHGIGEQFHTDIQVLHYYDARNSMIMRPGMTFTTGRPSPPTESAQPSSNTRSSSPTPGSRCLPPTAPFRRRHRGSGRHSVGDPMLDLDRYIPFSRDEWADLRAATPLTIREKDLEALRGINERIDLEEVAAVYLPLTRLLNLYVSATQNLHKVSATFLGTMAPKVPYVIGVAGSVAVGKSTFARILQALLARWPEHPKVDLVTTDGFLFPNAVLEERGIMNRKGFPESYDTKSLLQFLRGLKSGRPEVLAPVYSHVVYDIVEGQEVAVRQPDILILEGLNVLQVGVDSNEFVSDYFDFSIYIDAEESVIRDWYIERFHALRRTVFQDPQSFFRHFAELSDDEATEVARGIWAEINGRNLSDNIAPTKSRASLVINKGANHRVTDVQLRKL